MTSEEYLPAGRVEDFSEGTIRRVETAGFEFGMVKWHDQIFAFGNHCTHMGYGFDEGGYISPYNEVICTAHFACYDLDTGRLTDGPGYSGLAVYDVRIEDGAVFVATTAKSQPE